jgi:hypothetical protein
MVHVFTGKAAITMVKMLILDDKNGHTLLKKSCQSQFATKLLQQLQL